MDITVIIFFVVCFILGIVIAILGQSNKKKSKKSSNTLTLTHSFKVTPNTPTENKINELRSEARVYRGKDWGKAFTCLREADRLSKRVRSTYPIKDYLMLPEYLAMAELYDDSLNAYNKLLQSTQKRIGKEYSHQSEKSISHIVHREYYEIYTSMATRLKSPEYQEKANQELEIAEQLYIEVTEETDQMLEAYNKKNKHEDEKNDIVACFFPCLVILNLGKNPS